MILDDLFEQKPLPPHIKPSDLPPAMRSRLTMRDIEKERPRGAYRYRVVPGTPGESPKYFVDLPGAEQYAQAVKGSVQVLLRPIEEQADDPDVQRGMINLNTIEKQLNTNMKVVLQNETGQPAYQIELPVDKQWLISHAQEWIDAGKSKDLYKLMGTNKGFEFLLAAWQKEDLLRDKRARDVRPEEPDLFGASQAGSPKSPRYQDESQHGQKKNPEVTEAPQGARGRTERMMSQMRARQPQATSDLEALAYELQDAERRDAEEINKLEREVDSLETDIKSELQKRVATLTRRKGGVQQAAAADTKIDATLDQLTRVNDQQQRDIDDLTKAVASLGTRSDAMRLGTMRATDQAADAAQPAQPAAAAPTMPAATRSRAIDQAVKDLTKQAAAKTAAGGDIEVTPTGRIHRGKKDQTSAVQDIKPTDLERDTSQGQVDYSKRFAIPKEQDPQFALPLATGTTGLREQSWWKQFKSDVNTVAGLAGKAYAQQAAEKQAQRAASKAAPKTALSAWQSFKRGVAAASPSAQVPAASAAASAPVPAAPAATQPLSLSPAQQMARDTTAQAFGQAPAASGWKMGDPITVQGQIIGPKDPKYQPLAQALSQQLSTQSLDEKKRPQPTNPGLWSRAKSAARSKFDVYPSAYANAWAAKWYKSKGGGWRMGKPKKK